MRPVKWLVMALGLLVGLATVECFEASIGDGGDISYQPARVRLEWKKFKLSHGKKYNSTKEDEFRFKLFAMRRQEIDQFNSISGANYTVAINKFSDWTHEELKSLLGLAALRSGHQFELQLPVPPPPRPFSDSEAEDFLNRILNDNSTQIPAEQLDWRASGDRVTPVRDQNQAGQKCGSCYAFATVGLLEGQLLSREASSDGRGLIQLSAQDVLSCQYSDAWPRADGCQGGQVTDALIKVKKNQGIHGECEHPYRAKQRLCSIGARKYMKTVQGYATLPANDDETLKKVLALYGPVAVGIYTTYGVMNYKSGVIDLGEKECLPPELADHAVLVVGYGTHPKQGDYWIVKNSWGVDAGDRGYLKLRRGNARGANCNTIKSAYIATFQ